MAIQRYVVRLTVAVIATLVAPGRGRADEVPSSAPSFLTWVAPPGCPSEAELTRQVLGTMGVGVTVPASLRARAAVEQVRDRWQSDVELAFDGEATVRHVEGETCRAVADAVAVIVALAVSPEARRPAPPPLLAPAPLPAPPPPALDAVRRTPPFAVGATFLLDAGTLPGVAYGAELFGGWRRSRLELELAARFLAPEQGELSSTTTPGGATFWMAGGGVRGCYALVTGAFDVAPCGGVQGEWTTAKGFGATHGNTTGTAGTPVLSAGGRLTVRIVARFAVRLGVEAEATLLRQPFQIYDGGSVFGTVFRRSAVAGRGFVGPLLTF